MVSHSPEEILCHIAKCVSLSRKHKHLETFVGSDKGVNNSDGVTRVYVVVNVTVDKKQVAFKVLGKLLVGVDAVFESCKVNKLGKLGIGYNRVNDSEKKIFEYINKKIEDKELNPEGNLTLYTKWQPCPSCYYVISQFINKYPKIDIKVKYYKEYGEIEKYKKN